MPTYVIGDIHGCLKTFNKLLEQISYSKEDTLYLLGDYIDRGPDSKGVMDRILELQGSGYTVHTLRGNHEQMMMDAALDYSHLKMWLVNGGAEALESFGEVSIEDMEPKYKQFLADTQFYFEVGNYLLVHAGLNLSIDDPFSDTDAMLWLRRKYTVRFRDKTVVHGHTPTALKEILSQDPAGAFVNLDAGCVYSGRPGMGYLAGLCLDTKEYFYTAYSE